MIETTVTIEMSAQYLHELATGRGDMDTRSEVVMALLRPGGKVLVITKPFYPPGTYRLPTGGIHPGESPEDAFAREAMEETGLDPIIEVKLAVIHNVCVSGKNTVEITSHVFLGSVTTSAPHPIDEAESIAGYREADSHDLREISAHLRSIEGDWRGWARFRATVHDIVADYLVISPNLIGKPWKNP